MKKSVSGNFRKLLSISIPLSAFFMLMLVLAGCEKNGMNSGKRVFITLSDAAGDYQNVFVDIQKVEVKEDLHDAIKDDNKSGDDSHDESTGDLDGDDHLKTRDEFGEWKSIDFTPAVIDLLTLQNGIETILGTTVLANEVRKIRITLGDNNSLVDKDGVTHSLVLSNPTKNYLYIKIRDKDKDNDESTDAQTIRIDFDVANSIYYQNGQYVLKPVLRPFSHSKYGEIEGKVMPLNIGATVTIEDGQGFSTTNQVSEEGKFRFNGLNVNSTYKISIEAEGYITQIKEGVKVDLDRELVLPEIVLVK